MITPTILLMVLPLQEVRDLTWHQIGLRASVEPREDKPGRFSVQVWNTAGKHIFNIYVSFEDCWIIVAKEGRRDTPKLFDSIRYGILDHIRRRDRQSLENAKVAIICQIRQGQRAIPNLYTPEPEKRVVTDVQGVTHVLSLTDAPPEVDIDLATDQVNETREVYISEETETVEASEEVSPIIEQIETTPVEESLPLPRAPGVTSKSSPTGQEVVAKLTKKEKQKKARLTSHTFCENSCPF